MDRRRLLAVALVLYLMAGLVLTLVPANPLNFGTGQWALDVPVNLVMFAPPVAAVLLLRRRLRPAVPVAVAAFASASIEAAQALSPREASLRDWVLNTTGAALGALAVAVARRGGRSGPVRRLDT